MTLRKKIYLFSIIIILISLCLIFLIIYPLFIGIKKSSEELISQKKDLASLEAKMENLRKLKILYPEIAPDLEKIDHLFVDFAMPIEFIRFLEELSRETVNQIEISLLPLPRAKEDLWNSFSFQINSRSPFPNFLKFLEKLENSPYLIEITNLGIKRLAEREPGQLNGISPGDVMSNLTIRVFAK